MRLELPATFLAYAARGPAFADWLDGQTGLRVAYPRDGDRVGAAAGRVVMAPPGALSSASASTRSSTLARA